MHTVVTDVIKAFCLILADSLELTYLSCLKILIPFFYAFKGTLSEMEEYVFVIINAYNKLAFCIFIYSSYMESSTWSCTNLCLLQVYLLSSRFL